MKRSHIPGHPHLRLHGRPVRRGHRCPGGAGAQRDGGPGQDTLQHQAGGQDGEEEHVNSVHFVHTTIQHFEIML